MLNDGICDEMTNNKRCLFDGGDCCRQEKSTPLCKVCTCRLEVNTTILDKEYATHGVIKAEQSDIDFDQVQTVVTIEDVETSHVCSRICMDSNTKSFADDWRILIDTRTPEWRNKINAWTHDSNRTCQCLTMQKSVCPSNLFVDNNISNPVLIQMDKLLPCGKNMMFF